MQHELLTLHATLHFTFFATAGDKMSEQIRIAGAENYSCDI